MPRTYIGNRGPNAERRGVIADAKRRLGEATLKDMAEIIATGKKSGKSPAEVLAEMNTIVKAQQAAEKKVDKTAEKGGKSFDEVMREMDAKLKSQGG